MSYRATVNNGSVTSGDGQFEGAPAEMDPMGGNVGMETPYIEQTIFEPPPQTENFPYFELAAEDTMYVDGRRVPCMLDGMAVGCSMAMQALESGSAIPAALAPYQNLPGFQFNSYGLGIYNATFTQFAGYSLRFGNGDENWAGWSLEGAIGRMEGGETLVRNWNVFSVSWAVSWSSRISQSPLNGDSGDHAGGGGRGGPLNKGKKAVYSKAQLEKCLNDIGVEIKSLEFDRYSEGKFTGVLKGNFGGGPFGDFVVDAPLSTATNVIAKDSKSLAVAYNNTLDPGQTRMSSQSGLTLGRYPTNNWIASDIANNPLFSDTVVLALYIHELGNSIGVQLLGKNALSEFGVNRMNNNDKDYGTNLEVCVFRGIVGLRSGRVGGSREF